MQTIRTINLGALLALCCVEQGDSSGRAKRMRIITAWEVA